MVTKIFPVESILTTWFSTFNKLYTFLIFSERLSLFTSVSVLNIDDSATFNRNDKKLMARLVENDKSSNPFTAVTYKDSRDKSLLNRKRAFC